MGQPGEWGRQGDRQSSLFPTSRSWFTGILWPLRKEGVILLKSTELSKHLAKRGSDLRGSKGPKSSLKNILVLQPFRVIIIYLDIPKYSAMTG